jgi:hypothetical protein
VPSARTPDAVPAQDSEALLAAIRATGAGEGEAFVLLAQAMGSKAAVPHLNSYLQQNRFPDSVVMVLEEVGVRDPALANAALKAWPWGRTVEGDLDFTQTEWLKVLPRGLRVKGSLLLLHSSIVALPEDLDVKALHLEGTDFVNLPRGLVVRDFLDMADCPRWDGRIPADARVEGKLVTDRHPDGITLPRWRRLHPRGER